MDRKEWVPVREAISEIEVKSEIAQPAAYDVVCKGSLYKIRGAAWSGEHLIEKVEVSVNGGKSWVEAQLDSIRVLGDATRLCLLQLLMRGEKSVQELCLLTGMSQASVSKHLSILAEQGIISRRKQSLFVHYTIADNTIYQLCDLVCGALATRFEKVQQHLK